MGEAAPTINVSQANQNNLQNLKLELLINKANLINGVTGSGKTSLTINTISKLSTLRHAQFKKLSKSALNSLSIINSTAGSITNLPPVIKVESKPTFSKNDSVASASKIETLLHDLYLTYGKRFCPRCRSEVRHKSESEFLSELKDNFFSKFIVVLCDLPNKILNKHVSVELLLKEGFSHLVEDDNLISLSDLNDSAFAEGLPNYKLVLERTKVNEDNTSLISRAIHLGLGLNNKVSICEFTKNTANTQLISTICKTPSCKSCDYISELDIRKIFNFKLHNNSTDPTLINCLGFKGLTGDSLSEALTIKLDNISFKELLENQVADSTLKLQNSETQNTLLINLFSTLTNLGLETIRPLRACNSLSSGELTRLIIALKSFKKTSGALYVFDRPSDSLSEKELELLIDLFRNKLKQNNSIIISDQHPCWEKFADKTITLGPKGGYEGGCITSMGKYERLSSVKSTLNTPAINCKFKTLNSKELNIPTRKTIAVTGESASGKSRFLFDLLAPAFGSGKLNDIVLIEFPGSIDKISVVRLPQASTSRAFVANKLGLLRLFSEFYAQTDVARTRGYNWKNFQIGARDTKNSLVCENCSGEGRSSDEQICVVCKGKRYKPEINNFLWRSTSLSELLEFTIEQALHFIQITKNGKKLIDLASKLDISYLPLNRRLVDLSTGEAIKLNILNSLLNIKNKTLLLLEQPTQGLSARETKKFIALCNDLNQSEITVIAEEHNPYFIEMCDGVVEITTDLITG